MYKLLYTNEAKKKIEKLPAKKKRQIKEAAELITQNPEVGKHLTHELKGLQLYRSGDCRIIYRVYPKEILVLILTIGHRKDIYKHTTRKLDKISNKPMHSTFPRRSALGKSG